MSVIGRISTGFLGCVWVPGRAYAADQGMPADAPSRLAEILRRPEFARHREISWWEEIKRALFQQGLNAVAWVRQWFADHASVLQSEWVQWIAAPFVWLFRFLSWLLSFVWSVLSPVVEVIITIFNAIPFAGVLAVAGCGLLWWFYRKRSAVRPKQGCEQALQTFPTRKGFDQLVSDRDISGMLEYLRREARARLGDAYCHWTDRAIVNHLRVANHSEQQESISAVLEQFERHAYGSEPLHAGDITALWERFKRGGG